MLGQASVEARLFHFGIATIFLQNRRQRRPYSKLQGSPALFLGARTIMSPGVKPFAKNDWQMISLNRLGRYHSRAVTTPQLTVMFPAFAVSIHIWISRAIMDLNSAEPLPTGSADIVSKRATKAGDFTNRAISPCNFFKITSVVRAGAKIPDQNVASKSLTPASSIVGMLEKLALRFTEVTASAFFPRSDWLCRNGRIHESHCQFATSYCRYRLVCTFVSYIFYLCA